MRLRENRDELQQQFCPFYLPLPSSARQISKNDPGMVPDGVRRLKNDVWRLNAAVSATAIAQANVNQARLTVHRNRALCSLLAQRASTCALGAYKVL